MNTSEAARLVRIFDQLAGEAHALFMFCQALGRLHPDPQALLAQLRTVEQLGLAHIEASPLRDATVEAFQSTTAGLRRAIQANPRYNQTSPDQPT